MISWSVERPQVFGNPLLYIENTPTAGLCGVGCERRLYVEVVQYLLDFLKSEFLLFQVPHSLLNGIGTRGIRGFSGIPVRG